MKIQAPLFVRCLNGFFPFLLPRLLWLGCKADIVEKKKESDKAEQFLSNVSPPPQRTTSALIQRVTLNPKLETVFHSGLGT